MIKIRSRSLILLLTVGLCLSARGHAAPAAAQADPGPERHTIALAELMVRDEPIMLRGAASEYSISLPLAARVEVEEAMLELRFVNSISLLAHRSQLAVVLNGAVIAQVPLRGKQPEGRVKVRLPVEQLNTGYNSLRFRVAQHYSENCEDPASQELWTQIDSLQSRLSIKSRFRPLPATLAQLGALFDQRLWGSYRLHIVTPGQTVTEQELRWGALVSQGVALRLNYVPLEVMHLSLPEPEPRGSDRRSQGFPGLRGQRFRGHDTVLIGTRDALQSYLDEGLTERIEGAFLGVYPKPGESGRYVLVVSGRSPDEVSQAALALSFPQIAFADSPETLIASLTIPSPRAYAAKNAISEGRSYRFADLGVSTTTRAGLFPASQELSFWVPPDLFVPSETTNLELHLHMAYGAGLGPLSALNIHLNGAFQHAIHMDQKEGAVFYDYVIRIPMRSLLPGRNVLSFSPYLMPAERAGACQPPYVDGLLVTLFEDSYIRFADAAHFTRLPDLGLFSGTAFPYGVRPDGGQTAVQLATAHSAAVSAAWTLLARLSQITGTPFTQAQIGYRLPETERHLLVVGIQQDLDPRLGRAAPVSVADLIKAKVPVLNAPQAHPLETGILGRLAASLRTVFAAETEHTPQDEVLVRMSGAYSEHVALAQFESPIHPQKSVVVVSAARPEVLRRGVFALTKPALWGALRGSYALWAPGQERVHSEALGPYFEIGEPGLRLSLMYRFSRHPWIWSATVLGLLALLAVVLRWQLIRYRRRHHGPEEG